MSALLASYKKEFQASFFSATILHFLVDFVAVSTLVHFFPDLSFTEYAIATFLYDFSAFATQPLFGILADTFHKEKLFVVGSLVLLLIGFFIPFAWVALPLVGLGNAIFHVYAGKTILDGTENSAPLGVFISTGTIGLTMALNYTHAWLRYVLLGLLVVFGALYFFSRNQEERKENAEAKKEKADVLFLLPLILVSVGVLIRAFTGGINIYAQMGGDPIHPMLLALFVFLAKFLGGFFLDVFRPKILLGFSVLFAVVSFVTLNSSSHVSQIFYVMAVNLLMAFTLFYAKKAFPKWSGFGFGLLAALLLVGLILSSSITVDSVVCFYVCYALLVVNAILCLFAHRYLKRKEDKYDHL